MRSFTGVSGGVQRSGARNPATEFIDATDPLLDRFVPILVVVFVIVTGLSMLVQFTASRSEMLANSEESLLLATRLVASEATLRFGANREAGTASMATPPEAETGGRVFLMVGPDQRVRNSTDANIAPGTSLSGVFTADESITSLLAPRVGGQRAVLADGRPASVVVRELPNGLRLVGFQSFDDALLPWRRHAYGVVAMLLGFGAVTIAFSAAFYLQRARARETQESAKRLFNRFEVALDRGNVGLLDSRLGDRHVWLSNSMFRLLGLELGERQVNRAEFEALVHPDDVSPLLKIEKADPQSGEIDHLFRMRHAKGQWLWLHMRAAQIADRSGHGRLLAIVMDVTAEREAAAESERSDLRLRDAIESISEAFVLWDENNRLLLCNSKYRSFHGLPEAKTYRGTRYETVMSDAEQPKLVVEIDLGQAQDGRARVYEAQFEDGRWLLISERRTSAGGYVSVGTDITARKSQEERLIENERQLRSTIADLAGSREALRNQAKERAELADLYHDQKLKALSAVKMKAEFLSNMNHEIRTPLNAILGFAEVIENELLGPVGCEKYLNYASHIRVSGFNLLNIVNDVLEMAHIEAGRVQIERSRLTIGELLEEAATAVAADAAAKSVRLEIDPTTATQAGDKLIDVDTRATGQAIIHLTRNAIRLSPHGGTVTIRARMQGRFVNIFISDFGCHLSASEIGTLSEPFGHIDGMLQDGCKGSGLGVAIARGLIELQGGSVRIRSTPQIGALTMVHLPITTQPVQLSLPMTH